MAEQIPTIHRGLKNVVVGETSLSLVDGEKGRLIYRGYEAGELAQTYPFEDIAHLLWLGRLPGAKEAKTFRVRLAKERALPEYVTRILDAIPEDVDLMSVTRTGVSALSGAVGQGGAGDGFPPTVDQAISITAKVPTIVAYRHRRLQGEEPLDPRPDLSHSANYLYLLFGKEPAASQVDALDAYLILTMDHGLNASTFSARVTTSTESDLVSAITTAIGTMKGPLHGGAPSGVVELLEAIGTKENAEPYVRQLLERGERIMGFGHRVYKTWDPRAKALSAIARRLAGNEPWLDFAAYVEDVIVKLLAEYKPGRKLYTNVEFYTAAVLQSVGFVPELYTPTFTAARTVGWTAHAIEQAADNQIYRPRAVYVGPMPAGSEATVGVS